MFACRNNTNLKKIYLTINIFHLILTTPALNITVDTQTASSDGHSFMHHTVHFSIMIFMYKNNRATTKILVLGWKCKFINMRKYLQLYMFDSGKIFDCSVIWIKRNCRKLIDRKYI